MAYSDTRPRDVRTRGQCELPSTAHLSVDKYSPNVNVRRSMGRAQVDSILLHGCTLVGGNWETQSSKQVDFDLPSHAAFGSEPWK